MNAKQKHPKFFTALFGAFFRMFSWINPEKLFGVLLKKTANDDKIPTDEKLDEHIELLGFYMEQVWPLINFIVREKIMYFFRYKSKKFFAWVLLVAVFFGMAIGLYKIYNLYAEKPKIIFAEEQKEYMDGMRINKETIFIPAERSVFTKDNLDYFASEMDIKRWYDVRKQIIQETRFNSESCTIAFNLFGMKLPGQRETTAIGKLFGHAQYKHWVYSLYDYKLWQDLKLKQYPMRENEKYTDWLMRMGYAEDGQYPQKLNAINWYKFKPDKY